MRTSFLCGLIRIPDFVQNLFLNKKSYRLYIGIIYSSQKRREAVKLSYNRKRIKANKMMTGKNVMNSGMNYHSHFKEMEMVSVGVRLRAGSRGSYPFDGNTFI